MTRGPFVTSTYSATDISGPQSSFAIPSSPESTAMNISLKLQATLTPQADNKFQRSIEDGIKASFAKKESCAFKLTYRLLSPLVELFSKNVGTDWQTSDYFIPSGGFQLEWLFIIVIFPRFLPRARAARPILHLYIYTSSENTIAPFMQMECSGCSAAAEI